MSLQQQKEEYYLEKQKRGLGDGDGGNFEVSRYQPVFADKYKPG